MDHFPRTYSSYHTQVAVACRPRHRRCASHLLRSYPPLLPYTRHIQSILGIDPTSSSGPLLTRYFSVDAIQSISITYPNNSTHNLAPPTSASSLSDVFQPSNPPTGLSGPKLRVRSEEHTSELQSQSNLVCRLL